jgi:hypothetical protein
MIAMGMILVWLAILGVVLGVVALLIYVVLRILRRSSEPVMATGLNTLTPIDKEESRGIRLQIRRVLVEVWDPIGIKDEPNAQDEYDGYIGDIYELLVRNAPDAELAKFLHWVAHDRMGFEEATASDTQATVTALKAIRLDSVE